MILDLMLPRLNGVELCQMLKADQRTAAIFILMLTAKATAADRILGFESGADDYVVKPFSPREVVLRANRALDGEPRANHRTMTFGPVTLDESQHLVQVNGRLISLAATEFRLLATLMEHPNVVHSRDHLLHRAWGYERTLITRTVDTHIRRLRKKLGKSADIVETVRSYGYRLRNL
jgi:two-component system phosphate regulon response regulator PhoB